MLHSTVVDSNRVGTSASTGTLPKPTHAMTWFPQISEEITMPSCLVLTNSQTTVTSSMTNENSIPNLQIQGIPSDTSNRRIDFSNLNFPNPGDARFATVPGMNNTMVNTNNRNVYTTSAISNDRQVRFASSVNSSAPNTLPPTAYISNPPTTHIPQLINSSATTTQQPSLANNNPMMAPYYPQYMNNLANIPPYYYLGYPWNFHPQSYQPQFALPFGQSTMYGENTFSQASNSFIPRQQTNNNTFAAQQLNTSAYNLLPSSNSRNNSSGNLPQQSQFSNNWTKNTSANVAHDDSRLIRLLRDWKICFTGKPQEDADDFLRRLSFIHLREVTIPQIRHCYGYYLLFYRIG